MRFYESIRKHLQDRDVILDDPRFPVFIDDKENVAYFPLFTLSGKFSGYQRYNPEGVKERGNILKKLKKFDSSMLKYKTQVTRENPEMNIPYLSLYGLHSIDKRSYVFVTEGIFDAVKILRLDEPVVAAMGNDPKPLKNFFFALQKTVIAVLDNDEAGSKLQKIAHKSFTVPDPYKDIGEMPIDEVDKFIQSIKNKFR